MTNMMTESRAVGVCKPWCVDHHDGGRFPEDAFCSSERVEIAGCETHLSDGKSDDKSAIFFTQAHYADEDMTPRQARALAARLVQLAEMLEAGA